MKCYVFQETNDSKPFYSLFAIIPLRFCCVYAKNKIMSAARCRRQRHFASSIKIHNMIWQKVREREKESVG